ncbi:MAG: cache domain-containing protein, partial [Cyanobacteriota bacterium]|nr:cache domain-containing protein [Cyanobacteriota bacterium]
MTQRLHPILNPKIPLRLILVVPFVLQVVLGVGLVGYFSFRNGQRAVEDLATQLREESTARIEERLDTYLKTPHLINQINADAARLGQLNWRTIEGLEKYFWQQIKRFDSATYIYFGSETDFFSGAERVPDGTFNVAYWSQNSPQKKFYTYATDDRGNRTQILSALPFKNMRDRPWYKAGRQAGRAKWGDIYVWAAPYHNLALPAVLPLYNSEEVLQGVFAVDLSLLDIGKFLQSLEIGKTGETFIVERNGLLVATSTARPPFTQKNDEPERLNATETGDRLIRFTAKHLLETFEDFGTISQPQQLSFKLDGEHQLVQVTPYRDEFGLDWSIVVVVPEADFMAQIHQNNRITLLLCAIAFMVTTGFGIVTSHWITQPILQLGLASRRIAGGEIERAIEMQDDRVLYIEELKVLSESFHQMAGQLSRSF